MPGHDLTPFGMPIATRFSIPSQRWSDVLSADTSALVSTSTGTTILFDRFPAPTRMVGTREQPRRSYLSSRRGDGPEENDSRSDHSARRTAGSANETWTAIWTKSCVGRPFAGTLEGASALVRALWDDAATRKIALTVTR